MIRPLAAATIIALSLGGPVMAEPTIIEPVSDRQDADLNSLIATLDKAAEAKDFAPFEAALTPTSTASFGGDEGPEGFRRSYGIDQPDSLFWAAWLEAAALGGTFVQTDLYVLPYTAGELPDNADPYLSIIAVGDRTLLYAAPKEGAKVLGDVTHQLLEKLDIEPADMEKTGPDYLRVKADMGEGYVRVSETRSPLDYRAVFELVDGKWKLSAFVAGD